MCTSIAVLLCYYVVNWLQLSHLWDGSLKHVVAHGDGGRVHSGDDDDRSVWMSQSSRVFGKMEGHVDPTVIEQGQWFQMTCRKYKCF